MAHACACSFAFAKNLFQFSSKDYSMRIPSHATGLHTAMASSLALACALLSQPSAAQMVLPPDAAAAANPVAKVPAVSYRSVFKETSLGVEKDREDWRKANDSVGQFTRGHLDILKWEEQESAKAMKADMEKPTLPKPAAAIPPKTDAAKPVAAPAHKH
jgi:hypothetical protein